MSSAERRIAALAAQVVGAAEPPQQGDADLIVRPLEEGDYDKGFLELLSQLSVVGPISREAFSAQLAQMRACGDVYHTVVIEDVRTRRVVAATTLLVERKFLRGCSKAGHIEDVVVSKDVRGKQLGARIVKHATDLARRLGCYKVILDCGAHNVEFYKKLGFIDHAHEMSLYFDGHGPKSASRN